MVGLGIVFGRLRWWRLDVVDVYILMVAVFFGIYTFVDALVKDHSWSDPALAASVIALVIATLMVLWLGSRLLPPQIKEPLRVRYLITQWERIDSRFILLLVGLMLIFELYTYQQFGVFVSHDTFVTPTEETKRELAVFPYWVTSIAALTIALNFCAFVAATTKLFASTGKEYVYWLLLLVLILLFATFLGRRNVFYYMFIFILIWHLVKGRNLFTLRTTYLLLLAVPVLLVFSNIYQTYRYHEVHIAPGLTNNVPIDVAEFVSVGTSAEVTYSNLENRMAMWEFSYLILEKQQHNFAQPPYGIIIWQDLQNTIPKVLWPHKVPYNIDLFTADRYGLPAYDYPTNNFATVQGDFGYLSVIVLPIQLLFVFTSLAVLVQVTRRYPVLLLLFSGMTLYYLLAIESDYHYLVLLYRNIILVAIVFLTLQILLYPLFSRQHISEPAARHGR